MKYFMDINYLDIYNNLIKLTTNKNLYTNIKSQDTFSDRLTLFLLHFAFFLKNFKPKEDKKLLQKIYDFNFRQLELSIREIGYGDQSINKKMKDYLNLFYALVSEIHYWEDLSIKEKNLKISKYFENFDKTDHLIEYFDIFNKNLGKKTLNSFIKSVSKA